MAEKKNSTIKKARAEIEYLTGDEEVQRLAFLRDKWERDRKSDISHATEVGRKEAKKDDARKMLAEKIDIEIIMRVTGLTKEEIEKL